MTTYKQYLDSIIQRANDALNDLSEGDISSFAVAVNDVESDVNGMTAMLNKDEAFINVLEAEAKKVIR